MILISGGNTYGVFLRAGTTERGKGTNESRSGGSVSIVSDHCCSMKEQMSFAERCF